MKHKSHKHPVVNGSHLSEGLRLTLKQPERLTPHVMLKKVTWEKHSIIQFHQSFVNQDFVRGFDADGFTRDVRSPFPPTCPITKAGTCCVLLQLQSRLARLASLCPGHV